MPLGKKGVHDLYSPKIANKRVARKVVAQKLSLARQKALKEGKPDPSIPVAIDNNKVNNPLFGPHKIKKKEVEVIPRMVSPEEGKPIVNAKPAEHLIHKPRARQQIDPAAGAIEAIKKPKRGGKKNVKQAPRKDISSGTPEIGL